VQVGVNGETGSAPTSCALLQNYPNPFNPKTVIGLQIAVSSHVDLRVFDTLGREVAVLINERKAAGAYDIEFDAEGLASGIYICRLQVRPTEGGQASEYVAARMMALVR
jgi:hypothetical protein